MKRIVTIQDISAVGKCSLTVALPIISAMGVETAVIPTAVLSTHTAFSGFTFHDLTGEIAPIADHWAAQKIGFDAIYTGYLGSFEQLELVSSFIDRFGKDSSRPCLTVIDPVMADNGKLYVGFTEEFAAEMAKLCSKADVIVPNLTEACYMLGIPYPENGKCPVEMAKQIARDLTSLGCRYAVLTGMSTRPGYLGVVCYDKEQDRYYSYENIHHPVSFHGTGDVFSSALVGGLMQGHGIESALDIAVDYTCQTIKVTMEDPDHMWYGVNFETAIPDLIDLMKEKQAKPEAKGRYL